MAKYHVSKYHVINGSPKTSVTLKESIETMERRGIKISHYSKYSHIYGRYKEHNIVLFPDQIVNSDDIPATCEVVYLYRKGGVEWASYDDPVNCDGQFIPLVFVKKERSWVDALCGVVHESVEANKRQAAKHE